MPVLTDGGAPSERGDGDQQAGSGEDEFTDGDPGRDLPIEHGHNGQP